MSVRMVALFLLMMLMSGLAAQAAPLTATERVGNMANEEAAWRWGSGLTKLVVGGAVAVAGYTLFSVRDNVFAALICLPLGATIMVPGIIIFGWGGVDLLFGSREYEDEYAKLKLASDQAREEQAVDYLKVKAAKDKEARQPSFWNAFGLFSMFETPAEREYNAYQKAH